MEVVEARGEGSNAKERIGREEDIRVVEHS